MSKDEAFPTHPNGHTGGLTKRELFAAMAMQALLTNDRGGNSKDYACDAVMCADALLAELEKS